jgi:tRNA dimethylallyltransferase
MINYQKPIIVIAGPTASGKSSLAIELAKDINGYIINADSRQVYKELKIGTAQPIPDRVANDVWLIDGIKHYLYGHISAKKNYNLFQYQNDVKNVLEKEVDIPILVGGTGLYIDCIVHNYILKENIQRKTEYSRKQLEKMSVNELQSLLDGSILNKLNSSDRKNPVRLIRAIERGDVNREMGRQLNYLYTLTDLNTEDLEDRIRDRVNVMVEKGLVDEVQGLLEEGFTFELPSMHSIGYQEFEGYFDGQKSIEHVKDEIVLHTIQYSKRQDTWFKRNRDSIKVTDYKKLYEATSKFLRTS